MPRVIVRFPGGPPNLYSGRKAPLGLMLLERALVKRRTVEAFLGCQACMRA